MNLDGKWQYVVNPNTDKIRFSWVIPERSSLEFSTNLNEYVLAIRCIKINKYKIKIYQFLVCYRFVVPSIRSNYFFSMKAFAVTPTDDT